LAAPGRDFGCYDRPTVVQNVKMLSHATTRQAAAEINRRNFRSDLVDYFYRTVEFNLDRPSDEQRHLTLILVNIFL